MQEQLGLKLESSKGLFEVGVYVDDGGILRFQPSDLPDPVGITASTSRLEHGADHGLLAGRNDVWADMPPKSVAQIDHASQLPRPNSHRPNAH